MNRNKAIALTGIMVVCGVVSFIGTHLAAQKTGRDGSVSWLGEAAPSVIKLEEKFSKEADELIENLLQEQRNLALVIEDPCTPDESILAQIENVIAAHEPLFRRVGEHVATLRSKLPDVQRERLMSLCAEVIRGPMRQGRGRGYSGGMGRQDSSGLGRGQRGRGYGRAAGGRGYGQYRGQRGRLARRLGLTDEQILIIQEKDPDFEADLIQMRNTLLAEREELLNSFEDARTSNKELLTHINKLVSAHSQIERRIARHLLVLRPHLNTEQQKWLIGLCRHSQDRS
ncbi:hypothetical protein ACFL5Z_12470 [Planctomycetota bacterium]